MLSAFFFNVKGCGECKDRFASLNRGDPARGKASSVAQSIDLIDNGHGGVAGAKKIRMEGVNTPVRYGSSRRDEGLGGDLPPEHSLKIFLGAPTSKEVFFEHFKVKEAD